MYELIHAVVWVVITSSILLLMLLFFVALILARIQMWWMELHPRTWPPQEPDVCPECAEIAFMIVSVAMCDGLDQNGEEVGWSETTAECQACDIKFVRVDGGPWEVIQAEEWERYYKFRWELTGKTNPHASYYSGHTPYD